MLHTNILHLVMCNDNAQNSVYQNTQHRDSNKVCTPEAAPPIDKQSENKLKRKH